MGGANSRSQRQHRMCFWNPPTLPGSHCRARPGWGFSSDASFRYERGVDFTLQAETMERATALILDICGGQANQ